MNLSIVRFLLGQILKVEALLLLTPCIVALIYGEKEGLCFVVAAGLSALLGFLFAAKKPKSNIFYLKEGCVTTACAWILLSLIGCLPFYISNEIPSFTNALFETVSGFTTTGATILSDIESLSQCMLFWRSLTHWIGGMGVLVFLLAIAPLTGGSHMNLMKAESTGPSVGKLVPKVRTTARILYLLYLGLTLLQFILLIIGNVPVFDSVCIALGTAGTGGYAIKNDGFLSYSPYCMWVTAIFMLLFGLNFNFYFLIFFRKFKKAFSMEEVRTYLLIIAVAFLLLILFIFQQYDTFGETITHAFFQVTSIITTSGYASTDFDQWALAPKIVLLFLMFIGGCAGSTAGGIKVSRIMILFKTVFKELTSYIHPKSIKKIQLDHKPVEHEVVRATNVYVIVFILLFSVSFFLISFENKDFATTFSSVAATLNNVGPGFNLSGPLQNFDHFSNFSKFIMIFDMLAGRLELFPLLLLFNPVLWKEHLTAKLNERK